MPTCGCLAGNQVRAVEEMVKGMWAQEVEAEAKSRKGEAWGAVAVAVAMTAMAVAEVVADTAGKGAAGGRVALVVLGEPAGLAALAVSAALTVSVALEMLVELAAAGVLAAPVCRRCFLERSHHLVVAVVVGAVAGALVAAPAVHSRIHRCLGAVGEVMAAAGLEEVR
jgi:hypothetical protein